MYEDGLQMKNGFFRTRRFIQGSETSQDLFAEERNLDINEDDSGIPMESQQEAKRRKERLEKEEFIQRNTVKYCIGVHESFEKSHLIRGCFTLLPCGFHGLPTIYMYIYTCYCFE